MEISKTKIYFHITQIEMGDLHCEYFKDKYCELNQKGCHLNVGINKVSAYNQ